MCVTLGEAHLSQTTLYIGQASGVFTGDHRSLHVCGYQNRVQNLMPEPESMWRAARHVTTRTQNITWGHEKKGPGNAMILPFPALPDTMSQKNFLTGVDLCPHVLQDMVAAVTPRSRSGDLLTLGIKSLDVEIFELDIYTIVLARKARFIPDVIGDVSEEKRPPLKPSIFLAYDEWYPDWPIAVCCFNNEEAALANPLMPWYEPLRPEFLFAPALDCHTGEVPDLRAQVEVDHTLIVGVDQAPAGKGQQVTYQDQIPAHVRQYLPQRVMGKKINTLMSNGDFVFRADQVAEGIFNPMRLRPPGAPRAI